MPLMCAHMGTHWRDRILFDNLDIALQDLIALEEGTRGEPKWYPYHQAADQLFQLMETLQTQIKNAERNAYYKAKKGA